MKLELLAGDFAVCQMADLAPVDFTAAYLFLAKTDTEISLVCLADKIPPGCTAVAAGWRAFRIAGQLDFSLVGILAKIAAILAAEKISIFALSTFNTDYILVKAADLPRAVAVLELEGYQFAGA